MDESRTPAERLHWLDGIKGISCLCIFLHHFCLMYFPAIFWGVEKESMANGLDLYLATSPLGLLFNGNFFVHLFILISGYVMTYQVMKIKAEEFGSFMLKRYLKLLYPLFVFFGILFKGDIFLGSHLWMMNCIFLGGIIVGLISSLCWKYDGKKIMLLSIFCGVLVFIFFIQQLSLHYATIFFGCAMCLFDKYYNIKLNKYVTLLLFIIGLFFAAFPTFVVPENIYSFFLLPFDKENIFSKYFWHCVSAILVIYSVARSELLRNFFEKPIFLKLSKISFWVFLFHGIIISTVDKYIFTQFKFTLNYLPLVSIVFIIDLFLTILVSFLLYLYIYPIGNRIINSLLSSLFISKDEE